MIRTVGCSLGTAYNESIVELNQEEATRNSTAHGFVPLQNSIFSTAIFFLLARRVQEVELERVVDSRVHTIRRD